MTAFKNEWFTFVQMEFRSGKAFGVFEKRTPDPDRRKLDLLRACN